MTLLSNLMKDKMKEKGLSIREVAEECGISHTTIHRAIKGEEIGLTVMQEIAKWLDVEIATILGTTEGDISKQVSMLIETEPEFALLFKRFIKGFVEKKYDTRDLEDIISYAVYKLDYKEKKAEKKFSK